MKSVFLDYETMGPSDLDLSPLHSALPDLEVFGKGIEKALKEAIVK